MTTMIALAVFALLVAQASAAIKIIRLDPAAVVLPPGGPSGSTVTFVSAYTWEVEKRVVYKGTDSDSGVLSLEADCGDSSPLLITLTPLFQSITGAGKNVQSIANFVQTVQLKPNAVLTGNANCKTNTYLDGNLVKGVKDNIVFKLQNASGAKI